MPNDSDKKRELIKRLETLERRQDYLSREINQLRTEVEQIEGTEDLLPSEPLKENRSTESVAPLQKDKEPVTAAPKRRRVKKIPPRRTPEKNRKQPGVQIDLEKFIGENLTNKIGIAITIIGVAIGVKYSIENELISPLTRIIMGYLAGLALLIVGIRLKKKYENYSAVLVSGAMAIMYFITYSAYSFYELIPQQIAFGLMVVFTAFTVFASLNYNQQIIAHIGLVGAYAVPFLLSDNSGKVEILFSYIAIINCGILIVSFRKYWKPLFYNSFGLTWLIYFLWYDDSYRTAEHFGIALTFLMIFFLTFYLTFLAYKLFRKAKYDIGDVGLLLSNSFIFYGIGYVILEDHTPGKDLLGLFTLGNAIIHFFVSVIIYRKLVDRNLFYLVSGLVLVFISIAIPVQLDGQWVTILWAGEASLLFWIGRTKQVGVYEKLAYPLMVLAFLSILQDWSYVYDTYILDKPETRITPLVNVNFLTSLLFIAAFGFINFIHQNKTYPSAWNNRKILSRLISIAIPAILLTTVYFTFYLEIETYWSQLLEDSQLSIKIEGKQYSRFLKNYDLHRFQTIWLLNYSMLFAALLTFANLIRVKRSELGWVSLGLNVLAVGTFLLSGLPELAQLLESYVEQSPYYKIGIFNIIIRYISYGFVAFSLFALYRSVKDDLIQMDLSVLFDGVLHLTVLAILSVELIQWMETSGSTQAYKYALSILWGTYSLGLIALGIWKKKKHIRIGAIILFGGTLLKLFFYDVTNLDTIPKTILFVSLGVLLLIISFLYNKYKHIISDEAEN